MVFNNLKDVHINSKETQFLRSASGMEVEGEFWPSDYGFKKVLKAISKIKHTTC